MIPSRWSSAAAIPATSQLGSAGAIGIAICAALLAGAALSIQATLVTAATLIAAYAALSWSMPRSAIVVGLALMAAPYTWSPSFSSITLAPALVVAAVWIGVSLIQGTSSLRWHPIDLAVATYVAAPAISALIVGRPYDLFFTTFVNVLVPYAAMRLFISREDRRPADFVAPAAIGIGCGVAGLALMEVVLGHNPTTGLLTNPDLVQWTDETTRAGFVRAQASFGHPIALGTFLLIPIGFAMAWPGRRFWWTLVVLLPALLFTFSRGPWIGLVVTFVLILATETAMRGRLLKVLGLVLTVGMAAWLIGPVQEVIQQTFAPGTVEGGNAAYRSQLLEATFNNMTLVGTPVSQAETTYLLPGFVDLASNLALTALRTGILGLIAWFTIAALAVRSLVRSIRVHDAKLRAVSIVVITQCVVLVTVSLITNYQYWFWFAVALMVSYESASRRVSKKDMTEASVESSRFAS